MSVYKSNYQLDKINELAKKHGGTCISKEYTHSYDKYIFRCEKGHTWKTTTGSIRNGGSWCPTCRKEQKAAKEIKILHQIARDKGGECLSNTYVNGYHKLTWKCKEGHIWEATPGSIKTGTWCKKCAIENRVVSHKVLEELRKLAHERGGECLSTTYEHSTYKLSWKCKKGHVWEAAPATVRRGSWCPRCAGVQRLTMDDMHKLANQYSGKCLSSTYVNKETKLKWECEHGHQWMAMPGQLLYRKSWCPTCSNNAKRGPRITIDDMNKLVEPYNGKCLSESIVSSQKKLKWQCEQGHIWEDVSANIRKGKWCPTCQHVERNKRKLEQLHSIAAGYGGRCLATEYVSGSIKMMWECAEGHRWETTPHSIRQGTWCVRCRRRERPSNLTIVDMQKLAREHSGFCLSSTYLGMSTELKWMCSHRHAWLATPQTIRRGKWCPVCKMQRLAVE
ncbi:hypothetical protein CN918_30535 [Priestia megaterium]|nr:hypothetical protein CN918_30535 [Priestia megaterium]